MSLKINIWMSALKKRCEERAIGALAPSLHYTHKNGSYQWHLTMRLDGHWSGEIYHTGATAEDCLEKAQKWVEEWTPPKPEDTYRQISRPIHLPFDPRDIVGVERDFSTDDLRIQTGGRYGRYQIHRIRRENAIDWGLYYGPLNDKYFIIDRLIKLSDPRYFDPYAWPIKGLGMPPLKKEGGWL